MVTRSETVQEYVIIVMRASLLCSLITWHIISQLITGAARLPDSTTLHIIKTSVVVCAYHCCYEKWGLLWHYTICTLSCSLPLCQTMSYMDGSHHQQVSRKRSIEGHRRPWQRKLSSIFWPCCSFLSPNSSVCVQEAILCNIIFERKEGALKW